MSPKLKKRIDKLGKMLAFQKWDGSRKQAIALFPDYPKIKTIIKKFPKTLNRSFEEYSKRFKPKEKTPAEIEEERRAYEAQKKEENRARVAEKVAGLVAPPSFFNIMLGDIDPHHVIITERLSKDWKDVLVFDYALRSSLHVHLDALYPKQAVQEVVEFYNKSKIFN